MTRFKGDRNAFAEMPWSFSARVVHAIAGILGPSYWISKQSIGGKLGRNTTFTLSVHHSVHMNRNSMQASFTANVGRAGKRSGHRISERSDREESTEGRGE
jgi:hypothetical protein